MWLLFELDERDTQCPRHVSTSNVSFHVVRHGAGHITIIHTLKLLIVLSYYVRGATSETLGPDIVYAMKNKHDSHIYYGFMSPFFVSRFLPHKTCGGGWMAFFPFAHLTSNLCVNSMKKPNPSAHKNTSLMARVCVNERSSGEHVNETTWSIAATRDTTIEMRIYFFLCGLIAAPNRNACVCRAVYATRYIPFNFRRCLCVCVCDSGADRQHEKLILILCATRIETFSVSAHQQTVEFHFSCYFFFIDTIDVLLAAPHTNDQHKFNILVSCSIMTDNTYRLSSVTAAQCAAGLAEDY